MSKIRKETNEVFWYNPRTLNWFLFEDVEESFFEELMKAGLENVDPYEFAEAWKRKRKLENI